MTRRHRPALGIVELAVDPADVDQETYPVRIRLTRPLTAYEAEGLASVEPGSGARGRDRAAGGALDDVARDVDTWTPASSGCRRAPTSSRARRWWPTSDGWTTTRGTGPTSAASRSTTAGCTERARAGGYQPLEPGPPLNGPVTRDVIQPP